MPLLVTSNLLAVILLVILGLSGLVSTFRWVGVTYTHRRRIAVFKLPSDKVKDLKSVLNSVGGQFTLEVAVSQLSKAKSFYLTLPVKRAKEVAAKFDAEKAEDYELYYPGGAVVGAYAVHEGSPLKFNINAIDFSEINEIGEGAVVQVVVSKKTRKGFVVNLRTLISAPSSYQAKEIFSRIKTSLPGAKLREVKSGEFVDSVNKRLFDDKEAVTLSL